MRIKLINLWGGFRHDVFHSLIDSSICPVEYVNDNPDLVISFMGNGQSATQYPCARMQTVFNEAYLNFDKNIFDYALGDIDTSLDNTPESIYIPHYITRMTECHIDNVKKRDVLRKDLSNMKTCCFLGTYDRRPYRELMVSSLSRIGSVDAIYKNKYGVGKLSNDRGYTTKYDWIKNYKFTVAFENHAKPGYLTEKPFDPLWAGSIPIFFGDVDTFNHDFILDQRLIFTGNNMEEVLDTVHYYDTHDDAYLELVERNHFVYDDPVEHYRRKFSEFLNTIGTGRRH